MDKEVLKELGAINAMVLIQIKFIDGSMEDSLEPIMSFLFPAVDALELQEAFLKSKYGGEGGQYDLVISEFPTLRVSTNLALSEIFEFLDKGAE